MSSGNRYWVAKCLQLAGSRIPMRDLIETGSVDARTLANFAASNHIHALN